MGFEQFDFRSMECVGITRWGALDAVQRRVEAMRARGWDIPEEAFITTRDSPHGVIAKLHLPADCVTPEGYRVERWEPDRKRRTKSGLQPRVGLRAYLKDASGDS